MYSPSYIFSHSFILYISFIYLLLLFLCESIFSKYNSVFFFFLQEDIILLFGGAAIIFKNNGKIYLEPVENWHSPHCCQSQMVVFVRIMFAPLTNTSIPR